MTHKFKVGDRVKIVDGIHASEPWWATGSVGTITGLEPPGKTCFAGFDVAGMSVSDSTNPGYSIRFDLFDRYANEDDSHTPSEVLLELETVPPTETEVDEAIQSIKEAL